MLKVVTMYNFTKFTHWPDAKDLHQSDTIVLGVVGDSPFGDSIREMQDQLRQNNRKNITTVFHGPYHEGMDLRGNHILFISATERENIHSIIGSLHGAPVLTVSDTGGFLEAGGMISLFVVKNKIRWGINRTAIESTGMRVSSKLLQLAIKVENFSGHIQLYPYEQEMNSLEAFSREFLASLPAIPFRRLTFGNSSSIS